MARESWLPMGLPLPDASAIRSLLYCGEEWQVYGTNGQGNILVARPQLAEKWTENGIIDKALLGIVSFGRESFQILISHRKFALAPVDDGTSPESKVDALAFSLALRESRRLTEEASFHDAIYVEQYSRLLPAWTLTPHVDDEVVLGTWITGGVTMSTNSFRRLSRLAGWMPIDDLAEIIESAGLAVPEEAKRQIKRKSASEPQTDAMAASEAVDIEPEPARSQEEEAERRIFRLPGRPQLELFFNEHVIDIIFNAERYQALGIEFPSAIVLHGPPGCGKTFAVERLVEFIDWPSYSIDSNSVGSPYIHETSKKISGIFDKAIDDAPSVIVIDEMESFMADRRTGASSSLHHVEEVAEFLRRIPEAINSKVLIIGMTNMIEMIDPAILRRGRFDHVIEVGMPTREEVAALLDALLEKIPKSDDLNLGHIIDALTGKALSDSAYVIREAARIAAKSGKARLDQDSIESAINSPLKDQEKKGRRIGFVCDDK
jgi:cell division protease FtsH